MSTVSCFAGTLRSATLRGAPSASDFVNAAVNALVSSAQPAGRC